MRFILGLPCPRSNGDENRKEIQRDEDSSFEETGIAPIEALVGHSVDTNAVTRTTHALNMIVKSSK